jgi:hypothetical protein
MKIFIDRREKGSYPYFVRRLGTSYFLKIHGFNVNLSDKDASIDPVYIPLFKFSNEAGQTIIDIHLWRERCTTIMLMGVPPYIYIGRSEEIRLDYEEDDE